MIPPGVKRAVGIGGIADALPKISGKAGAAARLRSAAARGQQITLGLVRKIKIQGVRLHTGGAAECLQIRPAGGISSIHGGQHTGRAVGGELIAVPAAHILKQKHRGVGVIRVHFEAHIMRAKLQGLGGSILRGQIQRGAHPILRKGIDGHSALPAVQRLGALAHISGVLPGDRPQNTECAAVIFPVVKAGDPRAALFADRAVVVFGGGKRGPGVQFQRLARPHVDRAADSALDQIGARGFVHFNARDHFRRQQRVVKAAVDGLLIIPARGGDILAV